jgi:SAM-dependent methyltransferase
MGAASGVGFDISDEFIAEARELAALAKVDCDFVRSNIFDIDAAYFQRFDIVYISIGALCWFDDLQRFFKMASQVLKDGGVLFLYEMHPILDLFAVRQEEIYDKNDELKIVYSYFNQEPWVDEYGLDYFGDSEYEAETTYSFPHNFSEIVNAVLSNGLNLNELREYPHDISATFKHLERYRKIPMCYTLLARKADLLSNG